MNNGQLASSVNAGLLITLSCPQLHLSEAAGDLSSSFQNLHQESGSFDQQLGAGSERLLSKVMSYLKLNFHLFTSKIWGDNRFITQSW